MIKYDNANHGTFLKYHITWKASKRDVIVEHVTLPEIAKAIKSSAVKVYKQLIYYFMEDDYVQEVMFLLILTTSGKK